MCYNTPLCLIHYLISTSISTRSLRVHWNWMTFCSTSVMFLLYFLVACGLGLFTSLHWFESCNFFHKVFTSGWIFLVDLLLFSFKQKTNKKNLFLFLYFFPYLNSPSLFMTSVHLFYLSFVFGDLFFGFIVHDFWVKFLWNNLISLGFKV